MSKNTSDFKLKLFAVPFLHDIDMLFASAWILGWLSGMRSAFETWKVPLVNDAYKSLVDIQDRFKQHCFKAKGKYIEMLALLEKHMKTQQNTIKHT